MVVTGKNCNKQYIQIPDNFSKNKIFTLHNAFSNLSLSHNPTCKSDNKHVIVQLSKLAKLLQATNKNFYNNKTDVSMSRTHSNVSVRARNYFLMSVGIATGLELIPPFYLKIRKIRNISFRIFSFSFAPKISFV